MIVSAVIFSIYSISILLLFVYGINLFYLIAKSGKRSLKDRDPPPDITRYPYVTVQLPIFNERHVAERVIRGAASIDYPKNRFEIQILDDSTDSTLDISRSTSEDLQREGYTVTLLHREKRTGQKGGALREGLAAARGDFILIFDADFIPKESILKETLGYFQNDPALGLVQTRWGHINTEYSLLTRAQSLAVDSHFAIEQSARSSGDLFFNFNGTAGVWRKTCIIDSGNWQDDTLTEDLDLSYRAQLLGWKLKYLPEVVSPSELPVQINGYKSQQFRWAKGSIQTALKLGGKILSSAASFWKKIQGLLHVTYYSVHLLVVLNIALILPLLIMLQNFPYRSMLPLRAFALGLSIAAFAPPILCAFAQYRLYVDWKRRIIWIPLIVFLGTGVALNNSRAVLQALFKKKTDFIRTPKFGITGKKDSWKESEYRFQFSLSSLLEGICIIYLGISIYYAIKSGHFSIIPYLIYYLVSFSYVFILSFIHGLGSRRVAGVGKLQGAVNE